MVRTMIASSATATAKSNEFSCVTRSTCAAKIKNLVTGLDSRDLIGRAKGAY
jgi:hypothetical protein